LPVPIYVSRKARCLDPGCRPPTFSPSANITAHLFARRGLPTKRPSVLGRKTANPTRHWRQSSPCSETALYAALRAIDVRRTAGGTQRPSVTSLSGEYKRMVRLNSAAGAGSQFDSFPAFGGESACRISEKLIARRAAAAKLSLEAALAGL
jgi:hypothetical protein